MKNYIIPKTFVEVMAMNAFVCGVTSVNQSEQLENHEQLVPARRPLNN